jgi:MYXO-CTERM domain-containing protein
MSAVDTREDATYVAYCGYCDIVTGGVPFSSGIATNVGGSKDPKAGTANGWHIAAAKGLPERYVNSVRMDPANPRTVYVTLGGYGRRWIPPGSLGDDVSKIGRGHVYKSTDAGATFRDISGNLPDIGADDAFPFNGGLVVATDLGVYFSGSTNGGSYAVLGKGLPRAPVFRLNKSPRNSKELIAASYGRGVQRIVVAGAGTTKSSSGSGAGSGSGGAVVAPGAESGAPAPVAEATPGSGVVDTQTKAASDSRPFYRSPVLPVTLVGLLGLFLGLAVRRRRTSGPAATRGAPRVASRHLGRRAARLNG